MSAPVVVEREGSKVTITLDRPARRNAVTWPMWNALLAALREVGADPGVRALVLTGAGGAFCAGQDLSEAQPDLHPVAMMRVLNETLLTLHRLPTMTIARVDGDAVGAGCNLALACDFVVATERSRFAEVFVRRGLSVDLGGTWLLPHLVGLRLAKELCLIGDFVDGRRAERIGLIAACVPVVELDAEVDRIAAALAVGAPVAQSTTKRLLHDSYALSLEQAADAEAVTAAMNFASTDAQEARRAFLAKEVPVFTGTWANPEESNIV